ncbi:hypothetical protein [Streptomyces smyrnaeus]|uniref:hypothetical protein n=1 Tax=Streptomyces smyrnaeus TaxID=1387713 RepID=UPI0033D4ED80
MTSRHNERLQERRQALREQHKRELEEAKRRQAAQLASITAYDQRIAKLEDARRDVAAAVAEAVAAFGGRRDAAAALGLTAAEVRDYLNTHEEHAGSDARRSAEQDAGGDGRAGGTAAAGGAAARTDERPATARPAIPAEPERGTAAGRAFDAAPAPSADPL